MGKLPLVKFDIDTALKRTPKPAQHQGSLTDQMLELRRLAGHYGLYDADDWLQKNFFSKR